MTLAEAPDVLTVEQAADVLAVSRGTAYEAVRTGQIPSVRVGRCIRVPRRALEGLLGLNDDETAANGFVTREAGDDGAQPGS